MERYATASPSFEFDFIPLHLEDAFDLEWWKGVGGGSLASSAQSLGMDMTNESKSLYSFVLPKLLIQNFADLLFSPPPSSTPILALQTYLSSLPTQTAIHSATQTLVRLLLLYTAASRRASHVLLGTSLTSLSVNLISGIAQGAGFSVAEEAMEEWRGEGKSGELTPPIRIVRPLRDVGMKECAIWAWWCGLRVVGRERYLGGTQGIGSLTRSKSWFFIFFLLLSLTNAIDFIMGLERDYPATVSTIARTCAKLTPKEGSDGVCFLCKRYASHHLSVEKHSANMRSFQTLATWCTGVEITNVNTVVQRRPFLVVGSRKAAASREHHRSPSAPARTFPFFAPYPTSLLRMPHHFDESE